MVSILESGLKSYCFLIPKEYIARRIHEQSNRSKAPFVAVDCGAIPKELAASEFFGHIKGSFTGAIENKTGAFVAAQGGTIFLDEIGNLTYEVQVQLLRALQERRVKPIGSNQEIAINVRLISATNENLRAHERDLIKKALQEVGNNKTRAAQLLGIDRKTLYNKLKIYQLD